MRKLGKAGIPEDQAKAVVELRGEQVHISVSLAMSEVVEQYRLNEVATKTDFEKMESRSHAEMSAIHADLVSLKKMLFCQSVLWTFLVFGTVVLAIKGL